MACDRRHRNLAEVLKAGTTGGPLRPIGLQRGIQGIQGTQGIKGSKGTEAQHEVQDGEMPTLLRIGSL